MLQAKYFLLFRSNYYNEIYVDVSYPIIAIGGSNLYCLACMGFAAIVCIMEIVCHSTWRAKFCYAVSQFPSCVRWHAAICGPDGVRGWYILNFCAVIFDYDIPSARFGAFVPSCAEDSSLS